MNLTTKKLRHEDARRKKTEILQLKTWENTLCSFAFFVPLW